MAESPAPTYRFPETHQGIQVNYCKNVTCAAFGVPELPNQTRRRPGSQRRPGEYAQHGHAYLALMKCGCCDSFPPARSNRGIFDELARLLAPLVRPAEPCCPSEGCENAKVPRSNPGSYAKFGKTAAGSDRWRCNACRKTFTGDSPSTLKQRVTHKNLDVFRLLVNKSPIKRICEITGLHPKVVYGKIDFIHRQCVAFAGKRERSLLEGFELPKMYIAVDRQIHSVNWTSRKDRRNVQLAAIASADLASGFVFGFHVNFDPTLDPAQVELEATKAGDASKRDVDRQFAHLWLETDFVEATRKSALNRATKAGRAKTGPVDPLTGEITGVYAAAEDRVDIEVSDPCAKHATLPKLGMLVREQYTMHGHFQYLAKLLAAAPKVRVYMDQDSGIRAAFLCAFVDRIKARTADGWFVSILKETTIHDKERAVQAAKKRLADAADSHPGLGRQQLLELLMKSSIAAGTTAGQFGDKWVNHPLPNMSEPEKRVCWLTDMGDYDDDHAARLYLKGSLHAVDRFFMQTRRLLSMAERSIASANKDGRTRYGYSSYRPENLAKVLDIFRTYYNFCKAGKDKKTPAMRLGLARAVIPVEDILYFR
jgi:transposase-like protein